MHGRLTDLVSFSRLIFPDCDISLYAPFTVPCMPYALHFPTGLVTSCISVCILLCLMLYAPPCSGAFHCFQFHAFPHMPYRYLSNFRTGTVLPHVLKERLWLLRQNREAVSPRVQFQFPLSSADSQYAERLVQFPIQDKRPKFRRPEQLEISSLSSSSTFPVAFSTGISSASHR